jgi:hypothetical protein
MGKYFDRFPEMFYNSRICKNLLKRVAFSALSKKRISNLLSVQFPEGKKLEDISYDNYQSTYYYWILMLANNIQDPYYGVHLNSLDFDQFIKTKYGSIANAQRLTRVWRTNWRTDRRKISKAVYEAFDPKLKKYWAPITNGFTEIQEYERNPEDLILNTNKILLVQVSESLDEGFVSGSGYQFEVVSSSDTEATLKNVSGDVTLDPRVSSILKTMNSIPESEIDYWGSISFYKFEEEINEARRNVKMINSSNYKSIEKQLIKHLQE